MPLNKAANQGNDNLLTPYITIASNVSTLGSSVTPPNRGATTAYPSKAVIGDQFFDSTTNELKVFTVNGWFSAGTAPNAPTNVVATSAAVPYGGLPGVVITWTPATTGVPASSYVVTSSVGGFTQTTTGNSVTIYGLSPGTSYTFTVTAKNSFGSSSTSSSAITPFTLSQSPTNLSAVANGANSAAVTFTAPANNGGSAITSYTVTSSPGGFSASGATSPITVSGLTLGTTYTFTATATNAAGISTSSSPSNTMSSAYGSGGIVTYSGGYFYHAFTSTANFIPALNTTFQYLIVGGGGNGGSNGGGGGGGGGVITGSVALTAGNAYTAAIGGGATNSTFAGFTAYAGGQGDNRDTSVGSIKNSVASGGGGGGGGSTTTFTPQYGTGGVQGNNGGYGTGQVGITGGDQGCASAGGGGGGAGAVGSNANTNVCGNGGNGTSAYSTWGLATTTGQNVSGTVYYGGGGGGGTTNYPACNGTFASLVFSTGGYGGGYGSSSVYTGASYPNTGGGGAGGNTQTGSPNGGNSGVVIVRYAA